MNESLDTLRSQIDEQDRILLDAFLKRMKVSEKIADYKKENNLPIYVPERERALLDRVCEKAPPEMKSSVRAFFLDIMGISKSVQFKKTGKDNYSEKITEALSASPKSLASGLTVACQGVEGAYSQQALGSMFSFPNIMYFQDFEGVFKAVDSGLCRYGVLPIENSTAGSVGQVYDLMMKYNFYIVRSCRIKIDHCLLVPMGTKLEDVREIYSHEQAIAQCADFLSKLPNVKITPVSNTARAASMLAASGRRDAAAISSHACASLYGLDVCREDIQSSGNNHTRFICISKKLEIFPGADRTSLMLTLPHHPGSLYSILAKLNACGVNIEKLESRPIAGRDFEFMFYFDLRTPVYDEQLGNLLSEIESASDSFRYLGSYLECV